MGNQINKQQQKILKQFASEKGNKMSTINQLNYLKNVRFRKMQ